MSDVCEVLTSLTSDLVSGLNHLGGTKEAPPNHYVSLLHPYKHIKEECLLQIRQQPGEGGGGLPAAALQSLGLIQNHVLPFHPLEVFHVLDHQLVAGDHNVERGILRVERFLFTCR